MISSPETIIATRIAREAGALLRDRHIPPVGSQRQVTYKSRADLVTDVDLASEQLIVPALRAAFPGHSIVAEEGGGEAANPYVWLIDPLDGTTNYAHSHPVFAVTIALLHAGEPVCGVVYDPLRDECFVAERGQGAWLEDQRIHVSGTAQLEGALLSTGYPYTRWTDPHNNIAEFSRMIMRCQGILRSGSAALDFAYVASGRTDGHWELGLKPWDSAAGALLVSEAGGTVTNWHGAAYSPWNGQVVATNGQLQQAVLDVLNKEQRG